MTNTTTCELCGHELQVGEYPFCKGISENHVRSETSAIGDDIPGGIEIKHGLCHPDGTPRKFYSKTEIRKAEREAGLTNYVVHTPDPRTGGDKSKKTQRWV